MISYPSVEIALKIWQEGIDYRTSTTDFKTKDEYIFHTKGVAESARIIAENTLYLKPDKAYVLGLLHDYGKKYDERKSKIFHARAGYEELSDMGYNDCAKICLTHSFPDKNFDDKDYSSYLPEWIEWSHKHLQNIEYDDYDRLIQLCDMFFEGLNKVSFEKRFQGIRQRYNLKPEQTVNMENFALINKQYFSNLCKCDVYKLLNISDI